MPFLKDFYSDRNHGVVEVFNHCNLIDYKNYQLCITSEKALKCIELVDKIEIPNNYVVRTPLIIDSHLAEYKKCVPAVWVLEISIDRAPDIIAHYSQEQLIAEILR